MVIESLNFMRFLPGMDRADGWTIISTWNEGDAGAV
jgi:hypothetical protein